MPRKCPTAGSETRPLRSTRFRTTIQYGIAILICLTALDTAATPIRRPQSGLVESGIAQLAPQLTTVAAAAVSPSIVPLEAGSLKVVKDALRVVSGLIAKTSQQSRAAAVRMATISGFRG